KTAASYEGAPVLADHGMVRQGAGGEVHTLPQGRRSRGGHREEEDGAHDAGDDWIRGARLLRKRQPDRLRHLPSRLGEAAADAGGCPWGVEGLSGDPLDGAWP